VDVDPVASLRCWAIDVELGGRTFEVPALPAADWFPIVLAGDPVQVLDLLKSTPEDMGQLDEAILAGDITVDEIQDALTDAVEQAAGRSLHAAMVLTVFASQNWSVVNGHLAERGFRWDVMPLGAALDAIYSATMALLKDEDSRTKFLRVLDTPLIGRSGKRDRDKALSDFEAVAGPMPMPTGSVHVSTGSAPPRSSVSSTGRGRGRSSAEPSGSERPRTARQRRPRHQAGP
jgi:hypothetical protein